MKLSVLVIAGFTTLLMQGCASTDLSPEAASVKLVGDVAASWSGIKLVQAPDANATPPAECKLLGEVIGRDYYLVKGPTLGLASGDDERLILSAKNDLKNKAAKLGANIVYIQRAYRSSGDDVNISGAAYKCP